MEVSCDITATKTYEVITHVLELSTLINRKCQVLKFLSHNRLLICKRIMEKNEFYVISRPSEEMKQHADRKTLN